MTTLTLTNAKTIRTLRDIASNYSKPVTIDAVYKEADRVRVLCSDGRMRTCVLKTAQNVLNKPNLSLDAIYNKLSRKVGFKVVFAAANYNGNNWSADVYFIGIVSV